MNLKNEENNGKTYHDCDAYEFLGKTYIFQKKGDLKMKLLIEFDDGIELSDMTKIINDMNVDISFINSFKIINNEVEK